MDSLCDSTSVRIITRGSPMQRPWDRGKRGRVCPGLCSLRCSKCGVMRRMRFSVLSWFFPIFSFVSSRFPSVIPVCETIRAGLQRIMIFQFCSRISNRREFHAFNKISEVPTPTFFTSTTGRSVSWTIWSWDGTADQRSMPIHIPGIYMAPTATGNCGNLHRRYLKEEPEPPHLRQFTTTSPLRVQSAG